MSEYVADFVVAGGQIEASRPGERVTHADLAARLRGRLGTNIGRYVSGVVTRDEQGGLIRVAAPSEADSRGDIDRAVRARFRGLGPLEIVYSA